ncbi:multidrug ABC transporter permease/ATP-binding protein [Falseniella ignava]|uniref:Multidrug ABC transporter permease/ATP-binding protein n=1 Tax=Falseniella ignava TaxID=137730 RepID=A0A2I1K402_9LACT|nr:ABC transporter transmembrane domain-containing protein [Falseniella ignava]PKY90282.1 multidrug ABC transporter permease/ATP-binding protein [Falseniella ignava]
MNMFSKLGWFFKQHIREYMVGILMLILISLITAYVPIIIGQVIDGMNASTLTRNDLTIYAGMLLFIAIAQYFMRYIWRTKIFGTAAKLENILRRQLFEHFTKMDAIFFQKYRTGDLMARCTNDLRAIQMVAGAGILTLVDSMSQGLLTLFMMFFLVDWRLSLVSIIPIPLLYFLIRHVGSKLNYHSRKAQAAFSNLNNKVQESVTGVKVIKTFGEEELDIEDFNRLTQQVVDKNQKVYQYDATFMPVGRMIMGLATVISIFYGGFLVANGQITIGLLVAFISYLTRLMWPMIAIGRLFNILERGAASYDRIQSILDEKSHIIEAPNAIEAPIRGSLSVDIQEFIYPGESAPALQDIQFNLKAGQTLGVVGKTGSGKTTIFKLLLREYDRFKGTIEYDHQNIKDYSLDALLRRIGYVPQDNFLFSTTVRDNIRFANMESTQEEVEAAAKLVSVHDDILRFSQGYDTLVGERGVALSGGQKQRIAMARAMIIDPALLILDDSLSAVDAKTEERIVQSIKQNRSNKTTIISAHRLSSVMHADEIIVVDQGRITERGNHDELIAIGGWYREMFEHQQLEASETFEEEEV